MDGRAKVDGLEPKWTVMDESGRSFELNWTVMGRNGRSRWKKVDGPKVAKLTAQKSQSGRSKRVRSKADDLKKDESRKSKTQKITQSNSRSELCGQSELSPNLTLQSHKKTVETSIGNIVD